MWSCEDLRFPFLVSQFGRFRDPPSPAHSTYMSIILSFFFLSSVSSYTFLSSFIMKNGEKLAVPYPC